MISSKEKEKIREKAKNLGTDLVGFLNLSDYHSPNSPDPRDYLPNAKSIVVLALRNLSGAFETNTWSRMPSYLYCPEVFGNSLAFQLARYLEDEYKSKVFIVQIHRPFEITDQTYRMPIGTVSLRHAAVQCGLAVWGKNTLVLTKEFGPRVGFIGILNEVDIPSDKPITLYNPCSKCSFPCWEKCPGNAFQDGKVLSHRCVKYSQPYDPGNFLRYLLQMIEKETMEERKEMLKSYKTFNFLQYLQQFIYYQCWECTKYCPGENNL